MIAKVFGKVLRDIRLEKKISQEKLAEYCSLHRTYISLIERSKRSPTISTIFKLAKALDIEPSQLIKRVEIELSKNK